MENKFTVRKMITYFCMFLILLYPFNATIENIIYPNNIICLGSVLIGFVGLIITRKKISLKKLDIMVFLISILLLLFTLINNYYWLEGKELRVILFTVYLFLPFLFCINNQLEKPFYKIVKFFSIEHIIGTFIQILFRGYYEKIILTKICSGKIICTALGNNYHGYMTGFTTHFSTNAIYLSIATLIFFSDTLNKKNKKSFILFVLSLIALFTTGKRAHLIFTIICCLVTYLIQKHNNILKKYFKLICIISIAIVMFMVISKYIPEMSNILVRFSSLIGKGNVLNGRTELYNLAFKMWNNHLFFGNGWGSFSYFYQSNIYTIGSISYLDAHNVFIQLLCEVGILGFISFLIVMLSSFFKSLSLIKKHGNVLNNFIFSYQLFFILYCFTGNPLYDPMCYVIYFAVTGLTITSLRGEKDKI